MGEDKKIIYGLMDNLQELVVENENEDGTFRFDSLRLIIALEYAKKTLENSVAEYGQTAKSEQAD